MSIRDEEIKRLKKYAQSLGITVKERVYRRGDPGATYDHETLTIEMFIWPQQTKTRYILNFLHELGHHMDWVHYLNRNNDNLVLQDAMMREWDRTRRTDPVVPKSRRKLIYEMECRGIDYIDVIAKELNIKIPLWKIKAEQEYDKWIYYVYYKTGNTPLQKECDVKVKEIRKKYRDKYNV